MRIKVIKSSLPSYWYSNKIGQIFDVVRSRTDGSYEVEINGGGGYYVKFGDFVLLTEKEELEYDIKQAESKLNDMKKKLEELDKITEFKAGDRFRSESNGRVFLILQIDTNHGAYYYLGGYTGCDVHLWPRAGCNKTEPYCKQEVLNILNENKCKKVN